MAGYDGPSQYDNEKRNTSVLSEQTLDRVPNEKELATIANRIGSKWLQLTLELGLSQADFEQAQADHPHRVVDLGITILIKWLENSETTATFRELERALRQTDINTHKVFKDIK